MLTFPICFVLTRLMTYIVVNVDICIPSVCSLVGKHFREVNLDVSRIFHTFVVIFLLI